MKKSVLIVCIVVVLLFLSGIVWLIKSPTLQEQCQKAYDDDILFMQAIREENVRYCKGEDKEICRAFIMRDERECKEYPDQSTCRAFASREPQACDAQNYWCQAVVSKSSKPCEKIVNEEFKKECQAFVAKNNQVLIAAKSSC